MTTTNPYNAAPLIFKGNGQTEQMQSDGGPSNNTLINLRDAFAEQQANLDEKAKTAFGLMSEDASNLVNVASFTTSNAAVMNVMGAQTGSVKAIGDKIDQILRNLA